MDDMCRILLPLLVKVVPQIIIFVKLKLTNILRWDISPTPSNLNLWTDNPTAVWREYSTVSCPQLAARIQLIQEFWLVLIGVKNPHSFSITHRNRKEITI